MAQTRISGLFLGDKSIFLYELTLSQAETVLGGNTVVDLSTIHDGVNNLSNTFPSLFGIDNNKFFTFDFSRTTVNLVMMLPDIKPMLQRLLI
ncbi:hypothetical protein NIES2111_28280 [Nostoc sp. NIES-2111]|nr:hypothetical protein NIES2111_28280 [Nostoc sp. NIES-2111]